MNNKVPKLVAKIVKAAKPVKQPTGGSQQMSDPFEGMYGTDVIEPPYDPSTLVTLPESNNALTGLIDAYKTNIAGFGYGIKYTIDINSDSVDSKIKDQARKDWVTLKNFYDNCNFSETFPSILQRMIDNKERVGYGFLEVIPSVAGLPIGFDSIPSQTMRMTPCDPNPQQVPVTTIDADGKKITITFVKKFRKFVQIVDNTKIWFKEFGDPRNMDRTTGQFDTETDFNGKNIVIDPENLATSVIYFANSVPYSPYGIPRYMGNILSVNGSRKSEELNYRYFSKGKHVPMAILVKNGSLTESSVDLLQSYANQLEGVDNAFGYLVLEVAQDGDEAGFESGNNGAQTDIKLQPLTQTMQQDGLFQEYDSRCRDKIRAAYRLPPIYTGESKDYTRATADTARAIAEEQIFNPERDEICQRINKLVNNPLGVKYATMYLKGPNLTNKTELASAIDIYAKTGVLTPNMLIDTVSDLIGTDFERIEAAWADLPIQIIIAAMQNGIDIQTIVSTLNSVTENKNAKTATTGDTGTTELDDTKGTTGTDNTGTEGDSTGDTTTQE